MLRLAREAETFTVADVDLPVPNGDPDGIYTLRPLTRTVRRTINDKHTRSRPNPQTGRMDLVTDGDGVTDDIIDHVLMDWTGIMCDGAPAPCTREYKVQLDPVRLRALIERAGMTQAAHEVAVAESFRGVA